jgi:hypothetical protein
MLKYWIPGRDKVSLQSGWCSFANPGFPEEWLLDTHAGAPPVSPVAPSRGAFDRRDVGSGLGALSSFRCWPGFCLLFYFG